MYHKFHNFCVQILKKPLEGWKNNNFCCRDLSLQFIFRQNQISINESSAYWKLYPWIYKTFIESSVCQQDFEYVKFVIGSTESPNMECSSSRDFYSRISDWQIVLEGGFQRFRTIWSFFRLSILAFVTMKIMQVFCLIQLRTDQNLQEF